MSLLDEVLALGHDLPAEAKPVAADVVDVVSGICHLLEKTGVSVPKEVDSVVSSAAEDLTPAEPASPEEPPTIGSLVADVAPPPAPPEADPLDTYTVEQLTAELAKRQSAAVAHADANKSVVGPLESS